MGGDWRRPLQGAEGPAVLPEDPHVGTLLGTGSYLIPVPKKAKLDAPLGSPRGRGSQGKCPAPPGRGG